MVFVSSRFGRVLSRCLPKTKKITAQNTKRVEISAPAHTSHIHAIRPGFNETLQQNQFRDGYLYFILYRVPTYLCYYYFVCMHRVVCRARETRKMAEGLLLRKMNANNTPIPTTINER